MHCIILANDEGSFPQALRPMKGRAVIDYLIDEALQQKDITTISVITNKQSLHLIRKHMKNAYPNSPLNVIDTKIMSTLVSQNDDILILQGNVFTSLKLQDFIRYFKQFKTITKAAFDKEKPKEIPFYIVPKKYCDQIDNLPKNVETHTYNCGTGYIAILI